MCLSFDTSPFYYDITVSQRLILRFSALNSTPSFITSRPSA